MRARARIRARALQRNYRRCNRRERRAGSLLRFGRLVDRLPVALPVCSSKRMPQDVIRQCGSEPARIHVGKSEVNAAPDSRLDEFIEGRRKVGEKPGHAGQAVRIHHKRGVRSEVVCQDGYGRGTDDATMADGLVALMPVNPARGNASSMIWFQSVASSLYAGMAKCQLIAMTNIEILIRFLTWRPFLFSLHLSGR
jgi:hypothetical protein